MKNLKTFEQFELENLNEKVGYNQISHKNKSFVVYNHIGIEDLSKKYKIVNLKNSVGPDIEFPAIAELDNNKPFIRNIYRHELDKLEKGIFFESHNLDKDAKLFESGAITKILTDAGFISFEDSDEYDYDIGIGGVINTVDPGIAKDIADELNDNGISAKAKRDTVIVESVNEGVHADKLTKGLKASLGEIEFVNESINQIPGEIQFDAEPHTFLKDPRELDKAVAEVDKYLAGGKENIGGFMIDRYLKDSFDLDAFIDSVHLHYPRPMIPESMNEASYTERVELKNDFLDFFRVPDSKRLKFAIYKFDGNDDMDDLFDDLKPYASTVDGVRNYYEIATKTRDN